MNVNGRPIQGFGETPHTFPPHRVGVAGCGCQACCANGAAQATANAAATAANAANAAPPNNAPTPVNVQLVGYQRTVKQNPCDTRWMRRDYPPTEGPTDADIRCAGTWWIDQVRPRDCAGAPGLCAPPGESVGKLVGASFAGNLVSGPGEAYYAGQGASEGGPASGAGAGTSGGAAGAGGAFGPDVRRAGGFRAQAVHSTPYGSLGQRPGIPNAPQPPRPPTRPHVPIYGTPRPPASRPQGFTPSAPRPTPTRPPLPYVPEVPQVPTLPPPQGGPWYSQTPPGAPQPRPRPPLPEVPVQPPSPPPIQPPQGTGQAAPIVSGWMRVSSVPSGLIFPPGSTSLPPGFVSPVGLEWSQAQLGAHTFGVLYWGRNEGSRSGQVAAYFVWVGSGVRHSGTNVSFPVMTRGMGQVPPVSSWTPAPGVNEPGGLGPAPPRIPVPQAPPVGRQSAPPVVLGEGDEYLWRPGGVTPVGVRPPIYGGMRSHPAPRPQGKQSAPPVYTGEYGGEEVPVETRDINYSPSSGGMGLQAAPTVAAPITSPTTVGLAAALGGVVGAVAGATIGSEFGGGGSSSASTRRAGFGSLMGLIAGSFAGAAIVSPSVQQQGA